MRRVVVTGLGALTPVGLDVDQSWAAICAGRSGGGPITRFDCAGWPVAIAAELKGFDSLLASGDRRMEKRLEPFTQYALVAAEQALQDAGLSGPLGDRAGVYVGSGIGGVGEITSGALKLEKEGWRGVSPFLIPRSLINLAAGQIAMRWGARGPSLAVATACATGNHSIGEAWRAIRYGEADVAIAGGAEAAIVPLGMAGFMVMKALSKRNADPSTASRPFDIDRDGFVMGEGAGVVILEERERALARGARIYAELAGYALTNDAHHITAPPPGHEGAARCMRLALASAGMPPEDIDYINAHGTSTPANDPEEVRAVRAVFGAQAERLAMSSTKGATGHLLGAAGGVEAVFCCKALQEQLLPPTANLHSADPACDLDHVPGQARPAPLRAVMSNAFGFGGTNAVLVFRHPGA